MPKLILMPITGTTDDEAVLATALAAGRGFDAHLVALHVRPDVRREIASIAAADMGVTAGLDTTIARMEADSAAREDAAVAAWNAFTRRNGIIPTAEPGPAGVTGEWQAETGVLADWLAEQGRASDLIVTGREAEQGIVAMDVLEAALMDTGRPVLIAAGKDPAPLGGAIAIAWKDTREAAKAVAAALPFIGRARRVFIFAVAESNGTETDRSATRLARALRWHNPNVEVRTLRPDARGPVPTLLDAVTAANACLLAMGGYGHTRLREAVFGGFTRAILQAAPLPVLMAH